MSEHSEIEVEMAEQLAQVEARLEQKFEARFNKQFDGLTLQLDRINTALIGLKTDLLDGLNRVQTSTTQQIFEAMLKINTLQTESAQSKKDMDYVHEKNRVFQESNEKLTKSLLRLETQVRTVWKLALSLTGLCTLFEFLRVVLK